MENITFPGLNISFEINKVAFKIGETPIYWYGIIITIAFIIALVLIQKDKNKYGVRAENLIELTILIIPISIISARIYYVLFSLENYKDNILEIFNFRNGGLAIYGGIIGAVITIALYCKVKKIHILDVLERFAPYLPLGQAIGRWGNFFNSEAHGTSTNNIFRMGITENGQYMEVHPTFLYESVCNFIIFIILYSLSKNRKFKGQITYLYIILYSIARAIIEGLRTDSLMLGTLRISQILSILLLIVFGTIYIYNYKKFKQKNK